MKNKGKSFIVRVISACSSTVSRLIAVIALAIASFVSQPAAAQWDPAVTILRVDGIDGDINGNGSDWDEDAFLHLQDAIAAAAVLELEDLPCEIWVRGNPGAGVTYKPDQGGNQTGRTASFKMANDVRIVGGFAGWETALNQRDYRANITILSGDRGTASSQLGTCPRFRPIQAMRLEIGSGSTPQNGQSQNRAALRTRCSRLLV